jgi:hypothetical protein
MYWVVPAPEHAASEGMQVAVTSGSPPYNVEFSLNWVVLVICRPRFPGR